MRRFRLAAPVVWAVAVAVVGLAVGLLTNLVTSDSPSWWVIVGFGVAAVAGVGLAWGQAAATVRGRREGLRRRRVEVVRPFTAPVDRDGKPGVPALLHPSSRLSPFVGRSRELWELRGWCVDPGGDRVRIVAGPSGVGKSRLVTEVAGGLPSGWASGVVQSGRCGDVVEAVSACGEPTLVVVDDADTDPDVVTLLDRLGGHSGDPCIRLLLVVRDAEAFTAWLVSRAPGYLSRSWATTRVGVIGEVGDRRRWFVDSLCAYVEKLENGPVEVSAFDVGPVGATSEPMMVTCTRAALAAVAGGSRAAVDAVRTAGTDELAALLVDHEKRRWTTVAADPEWGVQVPGVTDDGRADAVLALVLTGPTTQAAAVTVVRRLARLADQPAGVLDAVVTWARHLYPGPDTAGAALVAPTPDFLAGALVARCADPDHHDLVAALNWAPRLRVTRR